MKHIFTYIIVIIFSTSLLASNCNEPTSTDRFNSLLKSVDKGEMADQKKFNLISVYAKRECFTVIQLLGFLDTITDHKLQISTAQSIINFVFDPENIDMFLSRFSDYEKQMIQKSVL